MSRQPLTETESPNHWCASSCAISPTLGPPSAGYVGRVWFSSANVTGRLVTRPPIAEKG